MATLYHVSEEPGIEVFEPRFSELVGNPVVWAVDEEHLCNYLFPRDCPRVCYRAGSQTSETDIGLFLPDSPSDIVIAIEEAWLDRAAAAKLYAYLFDSETFELADAVAGYFTSDQTVVPSGCLEFDTPLNDLASWSVYLRVLGSLWELRDAVVASTLDYSIIRMRNAAPR